MLVFVLTPFQVCLTLTIIKKKRLYMHECTVKHSLHCCCIFFILSSLAFFKELFYFPGVVICSFASWIVMLDLLTPPHLIFQEKQDPSSTSLQLRNEIQVGEDTCIRVALVKYRQMSLLPKVHPLPCLSLQESLGFSSEVSTPETDRK